MDINYNSDKIICVLYPEYMGGNFIINTLGLSQSATLPHQDLAREQLDGTVTSEDKIQFLLDSMANMQTRWNDLQINPSMHFFGHHQLLYPDCSREVLAKMPYNTTIKRLSQENTHYFCYNVHSSREAQRFLEIWPNARIIVINEFQKFLEWRGSFISTNLRKTWNNIRGEAWPKTYPRSLVDLDADILNELQTSFKEELYLFLQSSEFEKAWAVEWIEKVNDFISDKDVIVWNSDNFFSAEKTCDGINNIYLQLGLKDFNRDYVFDYYTSWINKVKELLS